MNHFNQKQSCNKSFVSIYVIIANFNLKNVGLKRKQLKLLNSLLTINKAYLNKALKTLFSFKESEIYFNLFGLAFLNLLSVCLSSSLITGNENFIV